MLWKWRWRAGCVPGRGGPPGWRCTPPLASDRSAQRKWWCSAAARSSLHHCPASNKTQSHAWKHSAAKALLLHIFNEHHTLVRLWRVQGGGWMGQSVGKRNLTPWAQSSRLCNISAYIRAVFGSLEHYTYRTELFCSRLGASKGLSLIYMEPRLHPAGFTELLLQMRSLATDGYQSLRQRPKTPMPEQVIKRQL